jgi:hypothetical protein
VRSTQRKPHSTWLGRFARGRRLDRNPLRRASDRAETALLAVLLAGFLAGAPFAAQAAGGWVHAVAQRQQAAQESSRYQVPAVLLTTASPDLRDGQAVPAYEARARWTAPDGATKTSDITVPSGTQAGTTVRIWITRDGAASQPPLLDSQVWGDAAFAEAGAVITLALAAAGTGALARRSLDKRRMAAWDEEWRSAGPRWSTRA